MAIQTERPPYEAYAAIAGSFVAGLGAVAALARRSPPATALDLFALSAATFKASRTLSREKVASFVREPFVEGHAELGEHERPAGEGFQRALGELVTCTRCVGTWSAASLASTQMLSPRFGRALTWTLAAGAANDFLQAAFAALCAKTNALEERRHATR
ncbi:MAG TPA: DUF1360 domain-containing protein [Gaiellaceae bacterium]|nr:DUF1360 domain-containing protein [Gaiellaceae bacterium]